VFEDKRRAIVVGDGVDKDVELWGKLSDDIADLRRRAKRRIKARRERRKKLHTKGACGNAKAGEVVVANVNANVSHCMTDNVPVPA
jgi:hypothetical protein